MNTNNGFENVFEFCCENTVFILALTMVNTTSVFDLYFSRILLRIANPRIHASTLKMMQLLYQMEPLKLTRTLSLCQVDFGTDFSHHIATSTMAPGIKSEIMPYLLHYIHTLVTKTRLHLPILRNLVKSIIMSYNWSNCIALLNIVGTEAVFRLCKTRDLDLYTATPSFCEKC